MRESVVRAVLIIFMMKTMKVMYVIKIWMKDEYIRLMTDRHFQCPFYRNGDEYAVVRKQM